MTHQKNLLDSQSVEKPDEVGDDVEDGVWGSVGRSVGVAVAAEVRGDGPVARSGEGQKLVAPRVPELREAVEEQYHWAWPNGCHVHVYSIRTHRFLLYFLHLFFFFLFFTFFHSQLWWREYPYWTFKQRGSASPFLCRFIHK